MNLQEQLNLAQEELKKVKERLPFIEKEKENALEEVSEARQLANDATNKLSEALEALRKADEDTEIERFRSIELEQAGIEAAQQSEDAWEKKIECVRNQHAVDISALLKTTEELQKLQKQLRMTTEAKNTALMHANDAMKIAEMNAEKVENLTEEVAHFKSLIGSYKIVDGNTGSEQDADHLGVVENVEVKKLRYEVEKAKEVEKRLVELGTVIEGLKMEVTDGKIRELDAKEQLDAWKNKTELLEWKFDESTKCERSTLDSLMSTMKQLDTCTTKLEVNMSEIGAFKEKIKLLETDIAKHKCDNDELQRSLKKSIEQVLDMEKTVEGLKSDIKTLEEEKMEIIENDKKVAVQLHSVAEEKEKIMNELDNCRDELETSKNALDDLASFLKEASNETRETKEKLVEKQNEVANAKEQIVELNQSLKSTEERYMAMLSDAREEIVGLEEKIERLEIEVHNSKSEWDRKEQSFIGASKKLEEERNIVKEEIDAVVGKLKETELEKISARKENALLLERIKEVEIDKVTASQAMEEAKMESLKLKEILLNNETQLQSITQQNHQLREKEEVALQRIKELSLLIEETSVEKENGFFEFEKEHKINPHENSPQDEEQLKEVVNGHIKEPDEESEVDDHQTKKVRSRETSSDREKFSSPEIEPEMNSAEEGSECKSENGSLLLVDNLKNNVRPDVSESEVERDIFPVENIKNSEPESKLDTENLPTTNGGGLAEEIPELMGENVKNETSVEDNIISVENINKGGESPNSKEKQQKKKNVILSRFGSLLKKKNGKK